MPSLPDRDYEQFLLYPSAKNLFRLPAYIRMDISLTWEKHYKSWSMAPYLQIFNVGNRENVWFIQYDNEIKDDRIEQKVETVNMFPILPTIGISFNF